MSLVSNLLSAVDVRDWIIASAAIITALAVIIGAWVKVRPLIAKATATVVALNELLFGRDAEPENEITGAPAREAVPGIGVQLARHIDTETEALNQVSSDVARLTDTVQRIAETQVEIRDLRADQVAMRAAMDARFEEHSREIAALKAQVVERVVSKVESTAAWLAVEAVANQQPGETPPEITQE